MFVSVVPGLRDEVAVLVVVELVDEELRVRVVADRDEERAGFDLLGLSGLGVAKPQAADRALAEHLVDPYGVLNSIFSWARARSTMICEARNSFRRWTSVTL